MLRYWHKLGLVAWISMGCTSHQNQNEQCNFYTNPILEQAAEPWAIFVRDTFYYTQNSGDKILLWKTHDITDLKKAKSTTVWVPKESENSFHLWGPEIHFIDGKWYIYFTADDGNTDNHHIYVIENTSPDPLLGSFEMKGKIQTDPEDNWGIHASVFQHKDSLYLVWSGWESKRVATETQCIYIAKMANPWTISSPRVLISRPEMEWERQWINPDGTRTAYPIFVNEAPQALRSPVGDKLFIIYSASGNWTPYYCLGMLWSDAQADILEASNWTKLDTPVFAMDTTQQVYSVGSFCALPSPDGDATHFLYQGRDIPNDPPGASGSTQSLRMQHLLWNSDGFPILGTPIKSGIPIEKNYSTKQVLFK